MRVLIADDNPVSLRILGAALDRMRHEVLVARDGREAWELFEQGDVPLVITDWLMPHMSGIELCERIRAEARDRYSYVVIATTLSDHENTLEGFRAGADDYLVKPLRVEELRQRIVVAERVRRGMCAKVEASLRKTVETAQTIDSEQNPTLLQTVQTLGELYRAEGAYAKARAFLRRQVTIVQRAGGSGDDIARLRRELASLEGLDDASI